MKPIPRLLARLAGSVLLVDVTSVAVLLAFAPRWLLLDEHVVADVTRTEIFVAVALTLGQLLVIVGLALGNKRALAAVDAGDESAISPDDLLALFAVPSRLAYARAGLAVIFGGTTLFARPPGVDSYTQLALVVLHLTLVSIATLPLYIAARAAVGEVLELAPVEVSREAVGLLARGGRASRVTRRFVVAFAAPVGLVAVGASILVYSHARTGDREARRANAAAFAGATLDGIEGHDEGRAAVIAKARELGFDVDVVRHVPVEPLSDAVVVPLEDAHAVVRFEAPSPGLASVLWVAAAVLAVALAAFAGSRIGAALSQDLALATREIGAMGVVDVLRGSRVFGLAYFQSVRRLATAVEEVGAVFREFAAAQERAIVARAAAERTRALLLATMSHDLKAPLNGILGFAGLLEKSRLTDAQRESVTIIRQRGRELLYLIETVLDAARVEARGAPRAEVSGAGAIELERHEAPSADVVMAAALDARELLQGSGRELDVQMAEDLPVIEVDSARVVQALVCLVHGASRMSDQGAIHLRAGRDESSSLRVVVEADAPSLSPEESARLADVDATASVKLAGRRPMVLALGISIARAILEAHMGSLDVQYSVGAPLRLVATIPPASASATVRMSVPPEMS